MLHYFLADKKSTIIKPESPPYLSLQIMIKLEQNYLFLKQCLQIVCKKL